MPVNLINEKDLNNYLMDVVYMGQDTPSFTNGNFKSIDYVRQNKDAIVKAMLAQYMKHRLRTYMTDRADVPFLEEVKKSPDLPAWAMQAIQEGRQVFVFDGGKMTQKMQSDISVVRDFLYATAEGYVDKSLAMAERTKKAPKVRLDYLKTTNEYDTFDKALTAAQKWHKVMAQNADKLAKDKDLVEKSLKGTEFVMNLPNNMVGYRLTTPEALDFESEYMGHCVGKGGYDKAVKEGAVQIYSIRDKNGEPHATFEVRGNDIYQCKGKGNKAPVARYRPAVQEFVRQMKLDIKHDFANIALIQQDGQYYDIYHLPEGFVVKGDLNFSDQDITELPDLSSVIVRGNFDCSYTSITSLQGSPKQVDGDFICHSTQITSLHGASERVKGAFDCRWTQVTSLEGLSEVTRFRCTGTRFTRDEVSDFFEKRARKARGVQKIFSMLSSKAKGEAKKEKSNAQNPIKKAVARLRSFLGGAKPGRS